MFHGLFTTGVYEAHMYEGPIQAVDFAGSEETPILRQLRWTDLVARIAATRDQRPGALAPAEEALGSFATLHPEPDEKGQRPVNRDALRHGKLTRISTAETANNVDTGDRETK